MAMKLAWLTTSFAEFVALWVSNGLSLQQLHNIQLYQQFLSVIYHLNIDKYRLNQKQSFVAAIKDLFFLCPRTRKLV